MKKDTIFYCPSDFCGAMSKDDVRSAIVDEIENCRNNQKWNCPDYQSILKWVALHCNNRIWSDKKTSRAISYTSYGLKHKLERDWADHTKKEFGYCANNWVKMALWDLGYDMRACNPYGTGNFDVVENDYTYELILDNSVNFFYRVGK